MWFTGTDDRSLPSPEEALEGRDESMPVPDRHEVLGTPLEPPFPDAMEEAIFGMGCFWGPEKLFWSRDGVYTTAVGYAGGHTPNPTYEEVCSGDTGHAEVVRVVFDPDAASYRDLLELFWTNHDPTQRMRQGPDIGTQYRSVVFGTDDGQLEAARETRDAYRGRLAGGTDAEIATEIRKAPTFYYAEPYHQQYRAK